MAKIEFSPHKASDIELGYQWVINEFKKHFPVVLPRTYDYGNAFTIMVSNGLEGKEKKRVRCNIEHERYSLNQDPDKKNTLQEIIAEGKRRIGK